MGNWLYLFVFVISSVSLWAQSEKAVLEKAEGSFAERQYKDAALSYNRYLAISSDPQNVYLKAAIANFEGGAFDKAKRYFLFIKANKLESKDKVNFHLGQLAQAKSNFEEAIGFYKSALKAGLEKERAHCKKLILQCRSAMKLNHLSGYAFVENLGAPINSTYDEIGPLVSPNFEGRIYFSSNRSVSKGGRRDENGLPDEEGSFAFDMYKADQQNGIWTSPRAFNQLLNSPRHEILYDFTREGQVAFFFRGLNTRYGEVLADTFRRGQDPKINSPRFSAPADAEYGDRDLFFLNDSVLLFASVRPEGYGGYDLYISIHQGGIWTEPKNLGPKINSAYHDRCPYVGPKGNLFYSSDRIESFGGFDIFYSSWTNQGWNTVHNMRGGINSSGDDLFFRRGKDDYSAFFVSDRKSGLGGFDLWSAYFKEPFGGESKNVSRFVQTVYGVGQDDNTAQRESGGSKEKWIIRPLLFQDAQEILSTDQEASLDVLAARLLAYPDVQLNILSFSDYKGPKKYDLYFSMKRGELCMQYLTGQGVSPSQLNVLACGSAYPIVINTNRPGAKPIMNINRRVNFLFSGTCPAEIYYDHLIPKEQVSKTPFGQLWDLLSGISFSVQIAATQQLYEGSALSSYRNPLLHTQAENPTLKYTLGIFERYEEARNLRYRLIKDGYQGAFITAYVDGIRRTRGELRGMMDEYPDVEAYINVE